MGRQLDAVDDGRLDNAAVREFIDRLRHGEQVIEDHQIDVDLPGRGLRSLLANALEIRDAIVGGRKSW